MKKLFYEILDRIIICLPNYWIMNKSYSPNLDRELNELMRTNLFEYIDQCEAKIGNKRIWIANHPYASFTNINCDGRPSRLTILRARRNYLADTKFERYKNCSYEDFNEKDEESS